MRASLFVSSFFLLAACSQDRPATSNESNIIAAPPSTPRTPTPATDAGVLPVEPGAIDAGPDAGPCLADEARETESCPKDGACAEYCARVKTHYRAGAASFVAHCLTTRAPCDEFAVMGCVDLAAQATCETDDAARYCAAFVKRCDPNAGGDTSAISQSGCVMYAKALSPAGRTAFRDCIEASITAGDCSTTGAVECADAIRH